MTARSFVLPAIKIQLPKTIKTAASQVVALDLDYVRRIADAAPPHLTAFVWLIATAGLRPGEAARLTVERVNFLKKTIDVDRQMLTPPKGSPHLAPTKTSASVRTVPINNSLVAELNRHMQDHPPVEIETRRHTHLHQQRRPTATTEHNRRFVGHDATRPRPTRRGSWVALTTPYARIGADTCRAIG